MVDRAALHPGRVKLVPVEGAVNTFDMTRADEPIQAGTPLNKGTLLSEPVASKLGLGGSATPSDALNALVDKKANKQQSADDAGKYWKIGTDGSLEFGTPVAKFSQGPLIITTSQTLDLSQYGLKIGDQINVVAIGGGGGGGGGINSDHTGGGRNNRTKANNGRGYGAGGGGSVGIYNTGPGGGGGACGALTAKTITLTSLIVTVTIGIMGIGGSLDEVSGSSTGNGGNGGTTSFGAYLSAAGGKGGTGGKDIDGNYTNGAGAKGQHNGGNGGKGYLKTDPYGGGGGAGGWIIESITVFSGTDGEDASSGDTDGAGGTPNGLENAGDGAVIIWW